MLMSVSFFNIPIVCFINKQKNIKLNANIVNLAISMQPSVKFFLKFLLFFY